MSDIQEKIREFSDEFLMNQYIRHRGQYTAEAVGYMEVEITRRGLSPDSAAHSTSVEEASTAPINEDFVQLHHSFNDIDLLLVQAILKETHIPFFVDSAASSELFPNTEASKVFSIYIPKSFAEKAKEQIELHFEPGAHGVYKSKYVAPSQRLTAFTFTEIRLSEKELSEEVEVSFSDQERETIAHYINRLIREADVIEQKKDRMLFYYDHLKELLHHIEDSKRTVFSKTDLLAILEVLQIYCDEPDFPSFLVENTAAILLDFFGV